MPSVVVGVSGGVDSSVAVHLLQEQGFEVEAVIFKQVNAANPDEDSLCCSASAIEEAQDVCHQLGVRLHTFDLRRVFKEKVIDPTIDAFASGDTPSPCTICNGKVRSSYLDHVRWLLKFDNFATGHYFRVEDGKVFRGIDLGKDQSYMVALVPREFFDRWLTPLGDYEKPLVRDIAAGLELATAHNPDSQDLCFKHLLPSFERDVVQDGRLVGKHLGRPTIGQKRGFRPLRVLDVTEKEVIVTNKDVRSTECIISDVNWLTDIVPDTFDVQLRSHADTVAGRVVDNRLHLDESAILVPGQVAAFYNKNRLLGGAIVSSDK